MTNRYSAAVSQIIAARDSRTPLPPRGAALVRQHFTVASEHKELQLLAWRDYLGRFLDVPVRSAQLAHGFHGEIDTYLLSDMIYLDSRTGPMTQSRGSARISTDNMRDFVFHVAVRGIIETATPGVRQPKASQYTPGILALDLNQPMTMTRPAPAHVLAFFLPRAMVEAALPDAEAIHGRVIGYGSPLTRMILSYVETLCQRLPELPADEQEFAIRTCAQLTLAAFGKQQRLDDRQRSAARVALQGKIEQYIQAHLAHEELSPESVMRAFPVARSTIYRMFLPMGGLGSYIRHCRLREAARELLAMPQLSVQEIGLGLGFGSASDFTRAFRRQYSLSPRDYRKHATEQHQR